MIERDADLEQVLADPDKIEAALCAVVRDALVRHKQAGNPVAACATAGSSASTPNGWGSPRIGGHER